MKRSKFSWTDICSLLTISIFFERSFDFWNKELSFEISLKKLEEIVEQLESGNIDLEKSVELYEKGIELKNICEEKLKKVELQIKKIKIENKKITKQDFN